MPNKDHWGRRKKSIKSEFVLKQSRINWLSFFLLNMLAFSKLNTFNYLKKLEEKANADVKRLGFFFVIT